MKRALSTGKVADYCYVTGDTVQNWIRSGLLPAQRTAGGQYRVRIDHLRTFMLERDMSVDELDCDARETHPGYCWEYYRKRVRRHTSSQDSCVGCIVKRTIALRCYELRKHVAHLGVHCGAGCSECGYYKKYHETESAGLNGTA